MNEKQKQAALDAEANYPKYVSTTGEPILVALTSGHNVSIGTEPTPIHPRFVRAAAMRGALPAEVAKAVMAEGANLEEQKSQKMDRLQAILIDMVAEAAESAEQREHLFTGDGKPDARMMSQRAGFQVTAADRDEAWLQYCAENDGED